jgi:hypothetical protein
MGNILRASVIHNVLLFKPVHNFQKISAKVKKIFDILAGNEKISTDTTDFSKLIRIIPKLLVGCRIIRIHSTL